MDEMDREFFKKYHRAVVKANARDVEKLKSRIGSVWADEFRDRTGTKLKGEEFNRALEDYLEKELRFCDRVEVNGEGEDLSIGVSGCHICHGNETLKAEGEPALCPIVPTGLFSISRVSERKASLKEVRKNGVVGECEICYRLN
jgi:hypothetical protein